jgi:hypothetical protein
MRIDTNNKIFESDAYLQDANRFYIIKMNFPSPDLLLFSDEENYVICRGKLGYPTWVWTADDIGETQMAEIARVLADEYLGPERNQITAKPRFYEKYRHRLNI